MEKHTGSLFNQKYFEGYRRCITMDENGHMRVEFVYEGLYHIPKMERGARLRHKALFVLLPAAGLLLMIAGMTRRTAGNALGYMTLMQVFGLFMLALSLVCGIVRAFAGSRLTEWEYRMGVLSVKELNLVGFLVTGFLAAAELVLIARGQAGRVSDEALSCALYALLSGAQFFALRTVMRERYEAEESQDLLEGVDVTPDVTPPMLADEQMWRN